HLVQAYQVYVLKWPVHEARGALGQVFPWLVHSEVLHYGYAVIMLAGIWALLPGFVGRSRAWWLAALVIQFWHHIEHALLQGQVIAGRTLFGSPVPTARAAPVRQHGGVHPDDGGHVLPRVPKLPRRRADAVQLRAPSARGDELTVLTPCSPLPSGEGRRPASFGRSSVRTPSPHCGEGTGGEDPKG